MTKGARLIDPTPPATISSASPALMARAAVITASMPEPYRRVDRRAGHFLAGRSRSSAMRATLRLSSPAWLAQPLDQVEVDGLPVDILVALDQRLQRDGAEIVGA